MDSEFDKRWQVASTPFDGVTVYIEDYVTLAELRRMLIPIVQILYAHCHEAKLFRLIDWHEHDGYINNASPTTWQELQAFLVSEDTLLGMSTGKTYVRMAFFPEQRDFLLRVYIPDIYDNPFDPHDDRNLVQNGDFDLTSQASLALRIRDAVQEAGSTSIQTMPAKAFFDKRYA